MTKTNAIYFEKRVCATGVSVVCLATMRTVAWRDCGVLLRTGQPWRNKASEK